VNHWKGSTDLVGSMVGSSGVTAAMSSAGAAEWSFVMVRQQLEREAMFRHRDSFHRGLISVYPWLC
jgi:hypothetical protein